MVAHLDTHFVSRFLRRVEEADASFDYLASLRELFCGLELASGGLAYSEADGSQSVLWNAPDKRIVNCSRELTEKRRHPTIKIAASRQYPFALYDFESEFSKDTCAFQLIQQFKQTGLDNTYAVPVHTPGSELHVFVLGKKGQRLSTESLLTLQAACQGVVGKMLRATDKSRSNAPPPTCRIATGATAQVRSSEAESLGVRCATGRIVRIPNPRKSCPGLGLHRTAPCVNKAATSIGHVSSEVAVLLDVLDALWSRYDVAVEADDRILMEILTDEIAGLARRIDERESSRFLMHFNDNAARH